MQGWLEHRVHGGIQGKKRLIRGSGKGHGET